MKRLHSQCYWQCLVSCGLCLIAQCSEVKGDEIRQSFGVYTVEGLIQHHAVPLGTNRALVFQFRAAVSNCTWAITTKEAKAGGSIYKQVYDGNYVSASALFDPEELKVVMEKAIARGALPDPGSQSIKPYNDSEMIVEARATPITGPQPMVSQIWLALASQCYLGGREEGSVDLSWFVDPLLSQSQFKTYAKWSLDRGFPHLPESITYFFDRERFLRAMNGTDYELTARPVANAPEWVIYSVDVFTNVYQLRLPKAFTFKGFESLSGPSRLVSTYKGEVTNVFLGVDEHVLDKSFGKQTVVMDRRSLDPKLVTSKTQTPDYLVTNGVLPSLENSLVQRAHVRARLAKLEAGRETHKTRWPYWLAIVGPVTIFQVYKLVHRRNGSNKS